MADEKDFRIERFTTHENDWHKLTPEEKEKLYKELGRKPKMNNDGLHNQG